jgi:putative endonuclease
MIVVYVLRSRVSAIYYVGITKDVDNRLVEHNAGKSKFTKGHRPWELIYTEESENWKAGRKREKYLKSAAGKRWLKKQGIIE